MTVLPGMPEVNPDAKKGCERQCVSGLVEREDGTYYPCPDHNAKAFERWSKGELPGWRDLHTDVRKAIT